MKKAKKVIISTTLILIILLSIFLVFLTPLLYSPIKIDFEKLDKLENCIILYDDNMRRIISSKDSYESIKNMPTSLINAFIAIEDKRYFEHNGIDIVRILGAMKNNLFHGTKQGGSTITQQLAKNIFLSLDKSYDRKIREIQIALKLEKMFSKEEILEKYLNMLYFGSGEYGVKNASRRFFQKDVKDLTIKECALLAGIIKSPTKYNPINNYENSIKRANLVLSLMHEQNLINDTEYEKAKNQAIVIKNDLIYNNIHLNYSNSVYFEASKVLNVDIDELPYMNLKIKTFLNLDDQNRIFNIINNEDYYMDTNANSLAMVLDNNTLGVKAYYANFNLDINTFRRQPGSTIKPSLVYAPALNEFNYHLFTKLDNSEQDFNGYSPKNYKNYYSESETLMNCLLNSYNTPTCKLLNDIGIDNALQYFNKMNIPYENSDKNLALALGGMKYGMTFTDIISTYSCFARDGLYDKPRFIDKIYDKNNNLIYASKVNNKEIFTKETSDLITTTLIECAKSGTANKLKNLPFDIASKTGTVSLVDKNYNQDAYNLSYTKDITTLFWTGCKKMDKSVTGGGITTIMTKDFYLDKYIDNTPTDFNISNNIKSVYLDQKHYDMNEYYIADEMSPSYNKVEVLINSKINNLPVDQSYTNIDYFRPNIKNENGNIILEFEPNLHLNYQILKRNMFIEKEIDNLCNHQSLYTLNLNKNSQYIIIPYYYDDQNNKIFGVPYKYGNAFSILDVVL